MMVQQPLVDAYAPLDAMERDAQRLIALALAIAALVGGAVAMWVVRPLGRLRAAADAMANGDLARRTGVARDDEIGDLASALDRMAAELQAREPGSPARSGGCAPSSTRSTTRSSSATRASGSSRATRPASGSSADRARPCSASRCARSWPTCRLRSRPPTAARDGRPTPDGSEMPVGVVVRATQTRSDRQYVAVLHDLSARKAAERAAALEEVNRLQREFISIASHELRTPAHGRARLSEILVDRLDEDDPNREIASMVHEQSIQLASLLEDVLDASRLEAGRVELYLESIDLSSALDSILRTSPAARRATTWSPTSTRPRRRSGPTRSS